VKPHGLSKSLPSVCARGVNQSQSRSQRLSNSKSLSNSLITTLVGVCATSNQKQELQSQCPVVLSSVVRQCIIAIWVNAVEALSRSQKVKKKQKLHPILSQCLLPFSKVGFCRNRVYIARANCSRKPSIHIRTPY
jgi:hypothetical protein